MQPRPSARCPLDLEHLQREPFACLGERTRRRGDSLPLGERLLECGEPLAGELDARGKIVALACGRARRRVGLVRGATELGRRRAGRACLRLGEICAQLGEQPLRRLVANAEPLRRTAQREQRVTAAAGEMRLRLGATRQHRVELAGECRLRRALDRGDARPATFGLDLQPCALGRGGVRRSRGFARGRFELDRRGGVERARRFELGPQGRGERRSRLAAQHDALAAASQAVQRSSRLLA